EVDEDGVAWVVLAGFGDLGKRLDAEPPGVASVGDAVARGDLGVGDLPGAQAGRDHDEQQQPAPVAPARAGEGKLVHERPRNRATVRRDGTSQQRRGSRRKNNEPQSHRDHRAKTNTEMRKKRAKWSGRMLFLALSFCLPLCLYSLCVLCDSVVRSSF